MEGIRHTGKGAVLDIGARPGSGRFSVSLEGGTITVCTRSPPEGNRANMEIVKELSRLFGRRVKIVRGLKSRRKAVLVEGASREDVERLLPKGL